MGSLSSVHLFSVLLCLVLLKAVARSQTLSDDCNSLRQLYAATDGKNWTVQWPVSGSASSECCTWNGVSCNSVSGGERVTNLTLPGNNLVGALPSQNLQSLSALQYLNLANNDVNGTLSSDWSLWDSLQSLDLSQTQLRSTLPESWSSWNSLETLSLSQVRIMSTLPSVWSSWGSIRELQLSSTFINGTLPPGWSAMTQLTYFNISSTLVRTPLPSSWSAWTNLVQIDLSNIFVTNTLPTEWGSWKNLKEFRMVGSACVSAIPEEWIGMQSLEILNLANTDIIGPLPSWEAGLPALRQLLLSNTALTKHTFPSSWKSLTAVEIVDLSFSGITGTLPSSLTAWNRTIQHFGLAECNVQGTLPSWISEWRQLQYLFLGQNYFSGTLHTAWAALTALQVLDLGQEIGVLPISGSLPTEWASMTQMTQISISNAIISGSLPASWQSMTEMQFIDLTTNRLQGSVPSEWSAMSKLQKLQLDNNRITGTLATEWAAWSELQVLSISANDLTGTLPSSFLSMTNLVTLDLSLNGLTGTLPSSYRTMKRLQQLNLGANVLTGSLPSSWGDMNLLRTLSLSGNRLSGPLPPSWKTLANVMQLDLSHNRLQGTLPSAWAALSFVSTLHLRNNMFTGTLPSEWAVSMTSLFDLDLAGNAIGGVIPSEWTTWQSMSTLDLSNNRIGGTLPTVWSFPPIPIGLTVVLSNNELVGTLPSEWATNWAPMNGLSLYLSYNRLNGSIPSEWGKWNSLPALQVLVANNELSGTLPTELASFGCTLENLDVGQFCGLVLYGNQLTGTLPPEWSNMTSVQVLDVSFNKLNGTLPPSWAAMSNLTELDLAQNQFTGVIPGAWSEMGKLASFSIFDNLLTGIDSEFLSLPLSSMNLYGNPMELTAIPTTNKGTGWVTVMDLSNTALQIDVFNLPAGLEAPPILRMNNNRGVVGGLDELQRVLLPRYVELGLRNTSIEGVIPNLGSNLPNLETLDVSLNDGMLGPLPVEWLFASDTLQLNVTGCRGLQGEASNLPFDPSSGYVLYAPGIECPRLNWNISTVEVIGLDPLYFQYVGCRCALGLVGVPPQCAAPPPSSDTGLVVGLTVSLLLLAATSVALAYKRVKHWLALRRDLRIAYDLLEQYSGRGTASSDLDMRSSERLHAKLLGDSGLANSLAAEWLLDRRDIIHVRTVASGASGSVSLAIWSHAHVALKEFYDLDMSDSEILESDFAVESALHARLRHPNVVQLIGVCLSRPRCTVTEWMALGSLFDVIHRKPELLPPARRIAKDISRGMAYLHAKGILHRDLKSLNVLLNDSGVAKVADFGRSRLQSEQTMTMHQGTMAWMAPELFDVPGSAHASGTLGIAGHYTEKCDVYSFAVILWELQTHKPPYEDCPFPLQIQQMVLAGSRPVVSSSDQWRDPLLMGLMKRCWSSDPMERPSFADILQELEAATEVYEPPVSEQEGGGGAMYGERVEVTISSDDVLDTAQP